MAKFTPVITKELQETVRKNPHIKVVYFADNGHHYFNKHKITVHTDDGNGFSKKSEEVDALPGVKQGVLKVRVGKEIKDKKVNVEYTAIASEMDRDEILDADLEEEEAPAAKAPAAKSKSAPAAKGKENEKAEDDNN